MAGWEEEEGMVGWVEEEGMVGWEAEGRVGWGGMGWVGGVGVSNGGLGVWGKGADRRGLGG